MGTLRLVLAFAVAYGHARGYLDLSLPPFIPGDTAVQTFYAISGFYMALVLNEKYGASQYSLFIGNRALRLMPAYVILLLLTIASAPFAPPTRIAEFLFRTGWKEIGTLDWPSLIYIVVSQAALIGQDIANFLSVGQDSLTFAPKQDLAVSLRYFAVPQAWTLGVEIWFYLLAPFIVRRRFSTIAVLLLASLAVRMTLQFGFGLSGDPWSYRFFPSELALFLCGALAYRVYDANEADKSAIAIFVICVGLVAACLLINRWNGVGRVISVGFLACALSSLPWLFRLSKSSQADRLLGEISYPLYICHLLVVWWVSLLMPSSGGLGVAISVVVSLAFAAALYRFVDAPTDEWRHRRLRNASLKAA